MTCSSVTSSDDMKDGSPTRAERIGGLHIEFVDSSEFEAMLANQADLFDFERIHSCAARSYRDVKQALLSFAEEQDGFRCMNFLKFKANRLRSTLDAQQPDLETMMEIERLLTASKAVRDWLIQANMGLVIANAGKYSSSSYGFDDLVSDGSLALMAAVEKFNYQRGFRFSTYATHSIRRSFFRRIERRQVDRKRFAATDPDVLASAADHFEVDFDAPAQKRLIEHIVQAFPEYLTDRERQVIECRFGLNARNETTTLSQLSSVLGICKERVRQVEEIALTKLRAVVAECSRVTERVELAL